MENDQMFSLDEVAFWIADGAIHFKITSPYNDPIELTSEAARDIANHLLEMADTLEREDSA